MLSKHIGRVDCLILLSNRYILSDVKMNRKNENTGRYSRACVQVAKDLETHSVNLWSIMQEDKVSGLFRGREVGGEGVQGDRGPTVANREPLPFSVLPTSPFPPPKGETMLHHLIAFTVNWFSVCLFSTTGMDWYFCYHLICFLPCYCSCFQDWKRYLCDGLHLSPAGSQLLWKHLEKHFTKLAESLEMIYPDWSSIDPDNPEASLLWHTT